MKKTLLIMLAVLLLFSFVSCKDSSEEIIAVYEEYKTTESIVEAAYDLIGFASATVSGDTVDYTVVERDINPLDLDSLLESLGIETENSGISVESGGKIEGTYKTGIIDLEFKNIEIKYTASGIDEKQTLKLSGTYKYEVTGESGNSVKSTDYNFKLNGKEYSLSYSMNGADKYTKAIVNGKNVELRLLNSSVENAN